MRRTRLGGVLLVLLATVAASCATGPKVRLPQADQAAMSAVARADRLVPEGCYLCLEEAAALYRQSLRAAADAPGIRRRLVDTLLLMAARERELGMAGADSLTQAREEAARLPSPWDYTLFLDVVSTTGWNPAGGVRSQRDALFDAIPVITRSWRGWRAGLAAAAGSDLLSQYLLLSFDCTNEYRLTDASLTPWRPVPPMPPLLRFRLATCGTLVETWLEDVRLAVPDFAETHYYLAQVSLVAGRLRSADRSLERALEALPGLVSARALQGYVLLMMEDAEAAREAYHGAVALVPDHREALLGEARALSYLGRHDEAIAVLDRMITLGTWYLGEAHYWRAWNRHRLKQYDAANEDVPAARSRLPMDPQLDKLAGLVALARNEIERAEREFRAAVEHLAGRGQRDCDAGYYLASTLVMQRKWAEAAPLFEAAVPCYAEDEKAARARIGEIAASDLPGARKVRMTAAKEREIAGHQAQQARAAFNAAVACANLGQLDKARPLAERAASHPDLRDPANALLARIR